MDTSVVFILVFLSPVCMSYASVSPGQLKLNTVTQRYNDNNERHHDISHDGSRTVERLIQATISPTDKGHGRSKRNSDNDPRIKDAMFSTQNEAYIQRNQTHHIWCPSRQSGERVDLLYWYKDSASKVRLATFSIPGQGTNFTLSDRYELSDLHGIIIHNVDLTDSGIYQCSVFLTGKVKPKRSDIKVKVLDTQFPSVGVSKVTINTSLFLERGHHGHEIQCPVTKRDKLVTTYWSLGTGNENFTDIIGAEYSDMETMVTSDVKDDYAITNGGNLIIKSLEHSQSRYWCHRFFNGLSSGYVDIIGKVVATQDFPEVTECGAPKNECKVKLEESKQHKINCSVTGVYPEVHLIWKLSGCNIVHRQEPFSFYDSVAETYDQYQELTFRAKTSTDCRPTFECFASGEAIPVPAISAKVLVTFTGNGLAAVMAVIVFGIGLLILVVVLISLLVLRRRIRKYLPTPRNDDVEKCNDISEDQNMTTTEPACTGSQNDENEVVLLCEDEVPCDDPDEENKLLLKHTTPTIEFPGVTDEQTYGADSPNDTSPDNLESLPDSLPHGFISTAHNVIIHIHKYGKNHSPFKSTKPKRGRKLFQQGGATSKKECDKLAPVIDTEWTAVNKDKTPSEEVSSKAHVSIKLEPQKLHDSVNAQTCQEQDKGVAPSHTATEAPVIDTERTAVNKDKTPSEEVSSEAYVSIQLEPQEKLHDSVNAPTCQEQDKGAAPSHTATEAPVIETESTAANKDKTPSEEVSSKAHVSIQLERQEKLHDSVNAQTCLEQDKGAAPSHTATEAPVIERKSTAANKDTTPSEEVSSKAHVRTAPDGRRNTPKPSTAKIKKKKQNSPSKQTKRKSRTKDSSSATGTTDEENKPLNPKKVDGRKKMNSASSPNNQGKTTPGKTTADQDTGVGPLPPVDTIKGAATTPLCDSWVPQEASSVPPDASHCPPADQTLDSPADQTLDSPADQTLDSPVGPINQPTAIVHPHQTSTPVGPSVPNRVPPHTHNDFSPPAHVSPNSATPLHPTPNYPQYEPFATRPCYNHVPTFQESPPAGLQMLSPIPPAQEPPTDTPHHNHPSEIPNNYDTRMMCSPAADPIHTPVTPEVSYDTSQEFVTALEQQSGTPDANQDASIAHTNAPITRQKVLESDGEDMGSASAVTSDVDHSKQKMETEETVESEKAPVFETESTAANKGKTPSEEVSSKAHVSIQLEPQEKLHDSVNAQTCQEQDKGAAPSHTATEDHDPGHTKDIEMDDQSDDIRPSVNFKKPMESTTNKVLQQQNPLKTDHDPGPTNNIEMDDLSDDTRPPVNFKKHMKSKTKQALQQQNPLITENIRNKRKDAKPYTSKTSASNIAKHASQMDVDGGD